MILKANRLRISAVTLASAAVIGLGSLPHGPAWAAPAPVKTPQKKNFAQRHPNLTSAAAGYAAYKIARNTGAGRRASGKKLNFAQRHPFVTGVAAAAATHHVIKKSNAGKATAR